MASASRLVIVGSLWFATSARADTQVRGTYSLTMGVTDNALSAPEEPPPGVQGPHADVFTIMGPGLILRTVSPRRTQELSYRFTIHSYGDQIEASSYSHRLAWDAALGLSPQAELLAGATVTTGRITAFDLTLTEAGSTRPPVTEDFITAGARELLLYELPPPWRLEQQTGVAFRQSLEDMAVTPMTLEGTTSATAERVGTVESRAIIGRAVVARSWPGEGQVEGAETVTGLRVGGEGRYRRDLNFRWSSEVRLGFDQVLTGDVGIPTIGGGGAIRYFEDEGMIELSASRDVRTDLFYGNAYVAEEMALAGRTPRRWLPERMRLTGRAALMRVHNIGGEEVNTSSTYVLASAASFVWETNDYLLLEAGAHYHRQMSEVDSRDYNRTAVMVSMTVNYPARQRRDPPRQTAPLRVDGSDQPQPGRR